MKFYIVDAFADQLFGGNTAGVVILKNKEDFPCEEVMIKTAAELKYSETAFVKRIGKKQFNIRYFTPAAEVDLCGHATIGAFGALLDKGFIKNNDVCMVSTLAGNIEVLVQDGFVFMDMSTPIEIAAISEHKNIEELAGIMGIAAEKIIMEPKLVSTGLPDIMLAVDSKETLMEINPDFKALAELSKKYEVVGVHAFALAAEEDITAYCRNFAPLYDIDEEAATGTSNGALTYYLYKSGLIKENEKNVFLQGESMNRPSKIMSMLTKTENSINIKVGGVYKILAKGSILLEDSCSSGLNCE
ncbi:MAG: PhzF family phenazine biosynthesis protein [Eubacteriales bacterium]